MSNYKDEADKIVNEDNSIINGQDLPDSPADAEKLKPETVIMDLPDVSDIPGQENITVMPLGEMADTTMSSADEEGESIEGFDDEETDNDILNDDTNVTSQEKDLLDEAGTAIPDDQQLKQADLDNEDDEGEPLNEGSSSASHGGEDLDIPGAEDDDADEAIGEEDEENNDYSEADTE